MRNFRSAVCLKCRLDFNYLYTGGRPRKYCPNCKASKGHKSRRSYNAYDKPGRPFPWGHLPSAWFVSRAGNACRTVGGTIVSLYTKGDSFWVSFPGMRFEQPRVSEIRAVPENVHQALGWAERQQEDVLRSFATH